MEKEVEEEEVEEVEKGAVGGRGWAGSRVNPLLIFRVTLSTGEC